MSNTVDTSLSPLPNLALENIGTDLGLNMGSHTRVGIFPFGTSAEPNRVCDEFFWRLELRRLSVNWAVAPF